MTFEEVKTLVKEKGYGTAFYGTVNGEPVYLSRGIREVFMGDEDSQKIIEAIEEFQKGKFGSALEYKKSQKPNHEYGRYELGGISSETEDTGVWVHKAEDAIIVYFSFER